ncbi:3-dehydroquinate dehydratase [Orenia metallireducens]|jgi:3-dehydroquinate dehydratase-2|uniref:3-dehydroquinate dehydratase n=1 Tax=Orenia metallireducens TaxID=1413210 RepID=A0A285I5H8_9FIRM|nr:type II 3-dehydroquinate dehydratase [Orenia metallireducens]PRX19732.1 3-dehydroquinate dehydratase [Orenia metallireducens]SNY43220.1 3-dehydroquinate dehydratase [Orenia metallireducens]
MVLVIHGPNLNLLGVREPNVYGLKTLSDINSSLRDIAAKKSVELKIIQSNSEGKIIDVIQKAFHQDVDAIIINPAAYTHYSIAIRDALAMLDIPIIEVHLSNIYKREEFRHKSVISPVVTGQIAGFGASSYILALEQVIRLINN